MLPAQIKPHFLFKTLVMLRGLVRHQSSLALPLLDRTAAFHDAVRPEIRTTPATLDHELHIVEQYLAITALRLCTCLRCRIEADAALHELALPPMVLQPLIENALVHGIEPCESCGELLQASYGQMTKFQRRSRSEDAEAVLRLHPSPVPLLNHQACQRPDGRR